MRASLILVAAPLAALLVYDLAVKFYNEHHAARCQLLAPRLEEYRRATGEYPADLRDVGAETIDAGCGYQRLNEGYIFVLNAFTLQAYEYDSRSKSWAWD